jgi:hypothetical protein
MCEDVTMELILQQVYDSIVAGEAPVVVKN